MAGHGARQRRGRAHQEPESHPPASSQSDSESTLGGPITARPARQRRPPTRYQGPNTDGEYFDLNLPPGASDDSDSESTRQVPDVNNTTATQRLTADLALNTARTDPLGTSRTESGKSQTIAFDIRHFFRKESERTVCTACE